MYYKEWSTLESKFNLVDAPFKSFSERKISEGTSSALEKCTEKENIKLLEIKAVKHKMWMDSNASNVQAQVGKQKERLCLLVRS